MSITTHVLDAAAGRPAAGMAVTLERRTDTGWEQVAARVTDVDGRVPGLADDVAPGVHRLRFDVEGYQGPDAFYPEVTIAFRVADAAAHHHVPLLLSPFAYSTYRGS